MNVVRICCGAILGLLVGAIAGLGAAMWQISRTLPPRAPGQLVGIDIRVILRTPIFWTVLLLCLFGFVYLFSLIGRKAHPGV
jgi:hypothetical protein